VPLCGRQRLSSALLDFRDRLHALVGRSGSTPRCANGHRRVPRPQTRRQMSMYRDCARLRTERPALVRPGCPASQCGREWPGKSAGAPGRTGMGHQVPDEIGEGPPQRPPMAFGTPGTIFSGRRASTATAPTPSHLLIQCPMQFKAAVQQASPIRKPASVRVRLPARAY
jgi:hypothetical protein